MANDSAYRKVETTGTGYRQIEATITLPSTSGDLNVSNGALYNYLGCSRSGVFDFEFGFGFKPVETSMNKYGIYYSVSGPFRTWAWLRKSDGTFYSFTPGSTYRFVLTAQNNATQVKVYSGSTIEYSGTFQISGVKADGTGQKVRRVSSLLVPSGASGLYALNNKWTTTKVTTTTTSNATPSNCTAGRYSEPSGNLHWVILNSTNQFYNETIGLKIR